MQISTSVGVVHVICFSLCSLSHLNIGCRTLGHKVPSHNPCVPARVKGQRPATLLARVDGLEPKMKTEPRLPDVAGMSARSTDGRSSQTSEPCWRAGRFLMAAVAPLHSWTLQPRRTAGLFLNQSLLRSPAFQRISCKAERRSSSSRLFSSSTALIASRTKPFKRSNWSPVSSTR